MCRRSDDWASYSLRHTFATLPRTAGVARRTAQEIRAVSLSNREIDPTMNVYTHLHLADTAGAVEALPTIRPAQAASNRRMTGTDR